MKILCTGDVHLGKPVSSLPPGITTDEVSAMAGWFDIVNFAVREGADLVALTGDVVDEANKYYEVLGALERGISDLARAGIPVVAVAGNHDHDVLPIMARHFPPEQFRLLGSEGEWERFTGTGPEGFPVHIDGWSFPSRHWQHNPLDTYTLETPEDGVLLGMLHADVDQAQSDYAPVSSADLHNSSHRLWMLGHIHKPTLLERPGSSGQPSVLYPGSPTAFHPGEQGEHGPWIITVTAGGSVEARHMPMSRVRFETLAVDVDGVDELDEIDTIIPEAIREHSGEILAAADIRSMPKALVYRLVLTGRTAAHSELEWHVKRVGAYSPADGAVAIAVDRVTAATKPSWDLDQIARMPGAPGYLARWVRDLQNGTPEGEAEALLDQARQIINEGAWGPFRELEAGGSGSDSSAGLGPLREELGHLGMLLLDELLSGKGDGP